MCRRLFALNGNFGWGGGFIGSKIGPLREISEEDGEKKEL